MNKVLRVYIFYAAYLQPRQNIITN